MTKPKVLVADDDEDFLILLKQSAALSGYDKYFKLITFDDPRNALHYFQEHGAETVITDVQMEGLDGMELFNRVMQIDPEVPVIIITAYASVEKAIEAVRRGAHHYFPKPVANPKEFWSKVHEAVLKSELAKNKKRNQNQSDKDDALESLIIGQSRARKEILQQIKKVCNTPTTVLITGETGTGKDLVARAIHDSGNRSGRPFVAIHCLEHPETLLESALFGHVKGAFTGAISQRIGFLEMAHGGTLFLDEVSEIPINTQGKLLRVLQDQTYTQLGSSKPRKSDFRLIAATNRDLKNMVDSGMFRDDLYYRLNIYPINIPPLNQRRQDILPLALYFLGRHSRAMNKRVNGLSFDAMSALYRYSWPGNVRELDNVMESGMVACNGTEIGLRDLNFTRNENLKREEHVPTLKDAERLAILAALQKTGGHKIKTAQLLGIHRNTLSNKMKEMNIGADEWMNELGAE